VSRCVPVFPVWERLSRTFTPTPCPGTSRLVFAYLGGEVPQKVPHDSWEHAHAKQPLDSFCTIFRMTEVTTAPGGLLGYRGRVLLRVG